MKQDLEFFKIEFNNIPPERGKILISEPFTNDPYFRKSVVLLTEHTKGGSFGFVLNKPVTVPLNELVKDLDNFRAPVSMGGPMEHNRMFYVHRLNQKILPNVMYVMHDVFFGGNFKDLVKIIKDGLLLPEQIKFFLGYAGWKSGQLENELKNNYWLVSDISSNDIFNFEGDLWKKKILELDEKYKVWTHLPESPTLN